MLSYNFEFKLDLLRKFIDEFKRYPKKTEIYKEERLGNWFYRQVTIYTKGLRNLRGDYTYKTYRLKREELMAFKSLKIDLNNLDNIPVKIEEPKILEEKEETFKEQKVYRRKHNDEAWNLKYNILAKYIKEKNHLPKLTEIYENIKIGSWLNNIRNTYFNGEKLSDGSLRYNTSIIPVDKIKKLKEIGALEKAVNNARFSNDLWKENFALFKEYLKTHNGNYPKQYADNNFLYSWVLSQRSLKKKIESNDSSVISSKFYKEYLNRIKILESINFKWNSNKEYNNKDRWNKKYELLKKYMENHNGNTPICGCYFEDVNLGDWLNNQRTVFNKGIKQKDGRIKYNSWILDEEKIKKIDNLGIDWVLKIKKYNKEIINNKNDLECKKRLLISKLNKLLLLNEKKKIESKEDVNKINHDFSLCLENKKGFDLHE